MSGQPPSSSIWWRWSANVFRWLLRLYPQPFREAYGSQMLQDFRDLWEEAAQQRGALGISHVCWETLGDLVVTAIAEQLRKELAMERRIVVRIGAALIWASAVFAALSISILMLSPKLPVRVQMEQWAWTGLISGVVFLVGLAGLQLKYRQRMPWYIGLIGSVTALAYFRWQVLSVLLYLGMDQVPGFTVLNNVFFNSLRGTWFERIDLATNLVYAVGMLVWGVSTLVKGIVPRWTAMLLMLFGVEGLFRLPFLPGGLSVTIAISRAFSASIFPFLPSGMPYALMRCLLLAGLGYALWVHNRPGRVPSEPNAAGPAAPSLPEGADPAV